MHFLFTNTKSDDVYLIDFVLISILGVVGVKGGKYGFIIIHK